MHITYFELRTSSDFFVILIYLIVISTISDTHNIDRSVFEFFSKLFDIVDRKKLNGFHEIVSTKKLLIWVRRTRTLN